MGTVTDLSPPPGQSRPRTAAGEKAFLVTPFARLARTHAGSAMGDAMVAAAFAGSLFFSLPADDARWPVLRYLIITMLPFSVLSPLIGPLIDRMRGGHRFMVIAMLVLRVVLCYLLIDQITGASTVFFLLALGLLVCQKAYQVARSALVPTVVRNADELVEANSKLSMISGIAGFVGVLPAGVLMEVFGAEWAVGLAMCTYLVAAVIALKIPSVVVAEEPADETERHELRGASIIMAGSAMGILRACVGFLTLLVAFDFRGGDRPPWQFGVVAGASVLSQLAGAAVAPRVRSMTSEENLLTAMLATVAVGGVLSLVLGDVAGATVLGSCVGLAAGGGKQAFDSILQRDAPDANRGRSFARFETRFQMMWVVGALVPVAVTMSAGVGFAVVLGLAVTALASYAVARMAYAHRTGARQTAATAAAVGIEERFSEVSGEVKERLAAAPRAAVRRLRVRHVDVDGDGVPDEVVEEEVVLLGEDDGSWPEPEWGGGEPAPEADAGPVRAVGRRRSWRRGRAGASAPGAAPIEAEATEVVGEADTASVDPLAAPSSGLADDSTVAWTPPEESEFPWEPPVEAPEPPGVFMADVDPAVANPFPWTPVEDDAATDPLDGADPDDPDDPGAHRGRRGGRRHG